MLAEAREVGIIAGSNPAKQLSENPNKVRSLNRYESSAEQAENRGVEEKNG